MTSLPSRTRLAQRAELTFKFNQHLGRHGWLRLTPAYSVRVVSDLLMSREPDGVLDPFCGSATTPLVASYLGYRAVGVELNPFLHWFGGLKLRRFPQQVVSAATTLGSEAVEGCVAGRVKPVSPPPIHNVERWWSPEILRDLCLLSGAIKATTMRGVGLADHAETRNLVLIAFCRTMMAESNAAFNHQSMSFKENGAQLQLLQVERPVLRRFHHELKKVLEAAADNPECEGTVILGDSRRIAHATADKYDTVITSPPYPNRISYIRELRPYMYWLGFLSDGREAGELDWEAIGGTWGVATSNLCRWNPPNATFVPKRLTKTVAAIASAEGKNSALLSTYVMKYFYDIWEHLSSLKECLRRPAMVHYIIGNSQFYGQLVEAEQIYSEMLAELGFSEVTILPLRKRNSNKALFEFEVRARLA